MNRHRVVALLLLLFAVLSRSAAHAQEIVPPIWRFEAVRITEQRVDVTIADQVATTRIDMTFVNDGDRPAEGTYLFPLPPGAAVSQLTMWVDGRPIDAKILGADEAQAIYDAIVRQLRDPALLKYVGQDAVQANVFPIPPGETRRIEIVYQSLATADNGLLRYVFPQSSQLYTNLPIEQQSIRVSLTSPDALRAVYSPTHRVAVSREGEFGALVGYEANNVRPEQDFELYWSVSAESIAVNLLSYREPGQDGFFLLLAAPSVTAREVIAKDVLLVFDVSGSMEGEKLTQAQAAARYVVDHLNPGDRFNIVAFSTGVTRLADGPVSAESSPQAVPFIDRLEALGGTNISLALLDALAQADPIRPTTIIFLTDGLATEGIADTPRLLDAVAQAAPDNVRLFAFGVGHDVDTFLLDSLTAAHGGTTTYVRPGQPIDEAVSSFYAKVSTPVLTDIALDFGAVRAEQLYPTVLPDLFAGSQLVLVGRYRDGGPTTITLSGTVNGVAQTLVYDDITFRSDGGDNFIPRLWATRAIGHMLTQIRLHGENPELVQSIVTLSQRYGIITPYTSYLIEEDDIFSQSARETAEEAVSERLAATRPVTGEQAVAEAARDSELAAAEAPMTVEITREVEAAPGGAAAEPVRALRFVGAKTFVYRDGIWYDTAFNPDALTLQQLPFAGERYFELLTATPELGDYFALGEQVVVVVGDVAYQVVPADGTVAETAPSPAPVEEGGADSAESTPTTPAAPGTCGSALFLPLAALALVAVRRRRS